MNWPVYVGVKLPAEQSPGDHLLQGPLEAKESRRKSQPNSNTYLQIEETDTNLKHDNFNL